MSCMINKMTLVAVVVAGVFGLLLPAVALAHCPLCTAGAGLLAVGAYWIGVKAITLGVLLGAMATAMGLWFGRLVKKQFVPQQRIVIASLSWLLTLLPLRALFGDYASWYVNWSGDYGSLFNRTYFVNLFLTGAVIGTIATAVGPRVSRYLTQLRQGQHFQFQGMMVTFTLVALLAVVVQVF